MAGLVYPPDFLVGLPVLLKRPLPYPPVRALDAPQFVRLRHAHLSADVPDHVLFPFLHGLDADNHHQRAFFTKGNQPSGVPDYRGLLWVRADEDGDELDVDTPSTSYAPPPRIPHIRSPSDVSSLTSRSSGAMSAMTSATSLDIHSVDCPSMPTTPSPPQSPPRPKVASHMLTSAVLPEDILTNGPTGPVFTPAPVPNGVSLRNFNIQLPLYATLCDIVVYSSRGATRSALALAERFKLAIEAKAYERSLIRQQAASSSSTPPPPLLAYNVFVVTSPFSTFEAHFPQLVAVDSRGISREPHVSFAQREKDYIAALTRASEIAPGVRLGNAQDVPVWREGDSEAPFDATSNPEEYDVCIECYDGAQAPNPGLMRAAEDHLAALDALWATGYNSAMLATHSSFFATPTHHPPRPPPNPNTVIHFTFPASPQDPASVVLFVHFLQRLLHRPRRCNLLVYSQDGYTENSVLALALLMAERRCLLPEAYLDLQVARGRSFFVYQGDLPILRRIEAKLGGEKEREGGKETSGKGSWLRRAGARATSPPPLPSVDHQTWFNDLRFDGSFPSRILDFLYLGNLNHAQNASMLHALGITHVVSVGECALIPPSTAAPGMSAFGVRPRSLWDEHQAGRIDVLDITGVCDDGIDSLRAQFASTCAWIDAARLRGGKVLVHCRVGVSRSATITIAYVMQHLGVSLVEAYLIVRSRRLSVLIQPNMRLLYNLCGWEAELARAQGAEDLSQALNWPCLAREVHLLNEKYLRQQ